MIFDTHAHYDDKAFDADREELLLNLPSKNVVGIINQGVDIESSEKSIQLSKSYSYIYSAVGIHPENIPDEIDDSIYELKKLILDNKKVVAVGEIGLDYNFCSENKEKQKILFESQILLALEHKLPVSVHDREAHEDTLNILKKYHPKGVVHCFSGSLEMAKEIIKLGMYLGIGGVVTFKNAKNIVEVVKNVPLEKLVLETDSPYLAPVPFRGKRCDSSYIKFVAERVAEIKDVRLEDVYRQTLENSKSLFDVII